MKSNLNKRTFIKLLGITFFSFFLMPFKFAKAVAKKVINENLTKKQKEIMFNEGTERPFTSDLFNIYLYTPSSNTYLLKINPRYRRSQRSVFPKNQDDR